LDVDYLFSIFKGEFTTQRKQVKILAFIFKRRVVGPVSYLGAEYFNIFDLFISDACALELCLSLWQERSS